MERMNGAINAREAELKEVIKINNKDIAYLKNRAKNAETELAQVKRDNKELEEENKKLKAKADLLQLKLDQTKRDNKKLEEENKKLREENEILRCSKGGTPEKVGHEEMIQYLMGENKKLKEELELVRKNTRANVETLDNMYGENVDLRKENEELKKDLEHRDSFFSIMRDVLANETLTNNEIAMITYCVVHEECGDYDLSKKELKIAKEFWERKYV